MAGDTYVDVRSEGVAHLRLAIELAESHYTGTKYGGVSHVLQINNGIYFGWHPNCGGVAACDVGEKLSVGTVVDLITDFLRTARYETPLDIDGDAHRGWRFVSHHRLLPDFYLSYGVTPEWMYYHK